MMSFSLKQSDSFSWVADRLPEREYNEMKEKIQEAVSAIARQYGMSDDVCDSFGSWSALEFSRN